MHVLHADLKIYVCLYYYYQHVHIPLETTLAFLNFLFNGEVESLVGTTKMNLEIIDMSIMQNV